MRIVITILLILSLQIANAQFRPTGVMDTTEAWFRVSSTAYNKAQIFALHGYVVRELLVFDGDKIPCIGEDSNCDYDDYYQTRLYLDYRKKPLLKRYVIWEVKY